MFITSWLYNICSVAILILITPFIELWIGNDYILVYSAVIALVLHMYVNGVQFAGYTYRTTLGLFERGKNFPIIASVINITLSIILGKFIGITGIFLATSIARLCTTTWLDAYLVHKYEFKTPLIKFIKRYILYFLIFIINSVLCYFITELFKYTTIINFILSVGVVAFIPNIVMFIIFCKSKEFINIKNKILSILKSKKIENLIGD